MWRRMIYAQFVAGALLALAVLLQFIKLSTG